MTFYRLKGKCIAYFCGILNNSKEIARKSRPGSFRNVWVATDSESVKTAKKRRNKKYYSFYKRLLNKIMDNQY
jgi:hypothetical protein